MGAAGEGTPEKKTRLQIFKKGDERERWLYYRESRRLNRESARLRRALARELLQAADSALAPRLPAIDRKRGYVICQPLGYPLLEEAIAEAREAVATYARGSNKREYDSLEGVPRQKRDAQGAMSRLARDPGVLRAVCKYLGFLPVLYRINLIYSPNDRVYEKSSQFFHLDPEDWRQVKVFVLVEGVDQDNGPLTLVPAHLSREVRRRLAYRNSRVTDEVMFGNIRPEDVVSCTGGAGTMVLADTCQCFHMGSRPGPRPRVCFVIHYLSPFAASFEMTGQLPQELLEPEARPPTPSPMEEYLFGVKR